MDRPLVSVVVPVFKAERYINACIESIVNQTYKNIEIILVDDGSPDRCAEICDDWAAKDKRIRVIHQPNKGAAAARNAGIKIASGKYIGFIDSDDYVEKDMYEVLVKGIEQSEARISCCYFVREFDEREKKSAKTKKERKYDVVDTLNAFFAGTEISSSACDKLFERSLFDHIQFPEGETNEEYPILIPLFVRAGGVYHCAKTLYFYRPTPESVTHSMWKGGSLIVYEHLCEMHDQLRDYGLMQKCKNFDLFCGRAAFSIALNIDKNYHRAGEETKDNQKQYISVMKQKMLKCLVSKEFSMKDKILYTMVAFRILRPVYKLLGRL